MRLIKSFFVLIFIFTLSASFSYSAVLYGAGHAGPDGLSTLYNINPDNGTQTAIGPIGFERCGGMDFHPVTNVLCALCERPDGSDTGVLVTINLLTGAGFEVGPTGINGIISDISFRNSDSVLFAENVDNDPEHTLYTININTGQATLVGDTGLFVTRGNGMSFDLADTLFLQTTEGGNPPELYEMNQTTGAAQFLRNVFFPLPTSADRFKALDANPESGSMFGIYRTGENNPTPTFLAILNIPQGGVIQIGPVSPDLDALAFMKPLEPIPTLSEWGLIAMAAILGIVGFMVIRRRKVTA